MDIETVVKALKADTLGDNGYIADFPGLPGTTISFHDSPDGIKFNSSGGHSLEQITAAINKRMKELEPAPEPEASPAPDPAPIPGKTEEPAGHEDEHS